MSDCGKEEGRVRGGRKKARNEGRIEKWFECKRKKGKNKSVSERVVGYRKRS